MKNKLRKGFIDHLLHSFHCTDLTQVSQRTERTFPRLQTKLNSRIEEKKKAAQFLLLSTPERQHPEGMVSGSELILGSPSSI